AGYAALFVAAFWFGLPAGALPALAAVAAVTASSVFAFQLNVAQGITNGAGAVFFGMAALFWGRVQRASQRNAQLVDDLRASRSAERRNAVAAERARLARELHDVLAHTLSSLSLHLESTRVLARSRRVDSAVVDGLERAVALARTGLDEARRAVDTLRDDAPPGPDRIPALLAEFENATGVRCILEEEGQPRDLAAEARVAIFRSVQEALTNVAKHSNARQVRVRLIWRDDHVSLTVSDDGTLRADTAADSQNGHAGHG